ncbi:MAG: hypothetical protein CL681_27510 [Blastopirellula sp.]|nr:hypothetical protein [Blastopirellula sp.]
MKNFRLFALSGLVVALLSTQSAFGSIIFVPGTNLGGFPKAGASGDTVVRKFDLGGTLPGLGFSSISTLTLFGGTGGGADGAYTGFDLDGIVLSYDDVTTYAQFNNGNGITKQNVFDFSPGGTFLNAGVIDPDPALQAPTPGYPAGLWGTDTVTGQVDNSEATLGAFDANGTTNGSNPPDPSSGFVSMGDGGSLIFTLTSNVSTAGLFLYVGEVGGQELLTTGFQFNETIPEPATVAIWGAFSMFGACVAWRKRKRNAQQVA